MLADGTEARARATNPRTDDEIRSVIDAVVQSVMSAGQLDDTELTLSDMKAIKKNPSSKPSNAPTTRALNTQTNAKMIKKEENFDDTKEDSDAVEDKASLEQTEKENSPVKESIFPQETTEIDLREGY